MSGKITRQELETDLTNELDGLNASINNMQETSIYKLNKDSNDIYTTTQLKRQDGTLYLESILSGGTSPQYTTRTETYYDTNGTTVLKTVTYNLSYDGDNLISEVIV